MLLLNDRAVGQPSLSPDEALLRLASMLESRERDIGDHCQRVAGYALAFGLHLGLRDPELAILSRAAVLHDIGLALVPDNVLATQEPFTLEQLALFQAHPITAAAMCETIPSLREVAPILLAHHELLDGSGYPHRLRGSEIPRLAQILGIIDAYDAMTSNHPPHPSRSHLQAAEQLRTDVRQGKRRGDLVKSFLELLEDSDARTHAYDYMARPFVLAVKGAID